jgi:hypothetical protein
MGSRQQWESSRRRRSKQPLTRLQERSDRIDLDIGAIMPFATHDRLGRSVDEPVVSCHVIAPHSAIEATERRRGDHIDLPGIGVVLLGPIVRDDRFEDCVHRLRNRAR